MKQKSINYKKKSLGLLVLLVLGSTTSYQIRAQEIPQPKAEMEQTKNLDNLLLEKWEGPYGGVPSFDKMNLALLQPAIEKGMALHLDEIEKIANNPEAPSFENTIAPMERAGKSLDRAFK